MGNVYHPNNINAKKVAVRKKTAKARRKRKIAKLSK